MNSYKKNYISGYENGIERVKAKILCFMSMDNAVGKCLKDVKDELDYCFMTAREESEDVWDIMTGHDIPMVKDEVLGI